MVQVVPFESTASKTRGSSAEGSNHVRSAAEIPVEPNALPNTKQPHAVVHATKSVTKIHPKLKNLDRVVSSEGLGQKQTEYRTLYLNDPVKNLQLRKCNNAVKTSKYTLWTLVPKNLFEQFRRLANIYFAIISILQVSTDLSPTNPYTSILTLGTMLVITLLKEAFEDWKRHKADKTVNRSSARVLQGSELATCMWQDLKVGDIGFIENGEPFPADMLLLSTSEDQGMCYIETSNLDGETNLKIRQALEATASRSTPDSLSKLQGILRYEQPNNRLYNFDGVISLQSCNEEPVDIKAVVLRGSMLRNTKWIYGLVIFTGKETKLIQNSRAAPSKRSNVEKTVNILIIIIFAVLLLMCTISTVVGSAWVNGNRDAWYLPFIKSQSAGTSAATWITFLILYNNVVPISLYVSMELVKVYQAQLIDSDLAMYHEETDTPALARTSNLNEDLGQIQYVFSDKTGTLTRNEMEFRKCSIGGTVYGLTGKDISDDVSTDGTTEPRPRPRPGLRPTYLNDPKFQFEDARLMRHLVERHPNAPNIDEFLRLLAVCHTVIPEKDRADPTKVRYEASSPDEGALVSAARNFGYAFATRNSRSVGIQVFGKEEMYEVLNVNEFTSNRKRMSIICRTPQNKLLLLCKGADSVIFERLKPDERNEELLTHLNDFATEGLRTLVLAKADLEPAQYATWSARHREASTALSQREEKLEAIAEEIEVNLTLLGATAIEDKLQEGVPDCIASMMAAGIKVWVLTGDKIETAINIGYSCHLLMATMNLLVIQHDTREKLKDELTTCLDDLRKELGESSDGSLRDRAIVIDGKPLRYIFEDKELQTAFLELAGHCSAVLACRVSPLQKAQVVRLVKRNVVPQPMTLAIGDGANDVSMIQEAHVGVGISGKEGMQAVRSADYAIGQFRFLKRLLLVHGRWDYQRISKVILYCFYKNIAMVLTLFYFGFFNGNSGTTLYESWLGALWNVGWTFFPIILLGVLDQDNTSGDGCSEKEEYRQYRLGQRRTHFNAKKMAIWVANAIWHSAIVFFLCYGLVGADVLPGSGQVAGVWAFGTNLNFALVLTVNLKVSLETRYWTTFNVVAVSGSFVFWILFVCAYSLMIGVSWDYYQVAFYMFRAPIFWLTSLVVPVFALLPDFTTKFVAQNYSRAEAESEPDKGAAAHRGSVSARDPITDKLLSMKQLFGVGNQSIKIKRKPKPTGYRPHMSTGFAFNYPQWASDQEQITDVNTFTARPKKNASHPKTTTI